MSENRMLAALVFHPLAGAVLSGIIGRKGEKVRDYFADLIAVSEFLMALALFMDNAGKGGAAESGQCFLPGVCGMGLHFTAEGFRLLYGLIAAFMWMMTTILSREYMLHHENRNRYYLFLLATLGATMGVFLSADLFTMFVFFEMMSFTSYVWVAQEETENALKAAATYLAVAVIGGLVMLMGIFLLYHELGTLNIAELFPAAQAFSGNRAVLYGAGACLLVGFGAKAGAFPLHIWLPKAHPAAPAPASALLSGILTKTGIFGILAVSCHLFLFDRAWGSLVLGIGVLTMFGGAFLAVFSVDIKRTLACSSMSQIGFILVGVGMQGLLGMENLTAVHGTLLHMANHSLIKLVLFMAAGVIFMNAHALDLNEIRGFGRKKPLLKIIFLIGALAISGIPLFGGYVSKTLLHESILEYGGGSLMKAAELIFLISGGLTAAYMTKLFIAVFVEKNKDAGKQAQYDEKRAYMNWESGFALGGSAFVLFLWGLFPHMLMDRAAELCSCFMNSFAVEAAGERVAYFSLSNLKEALISIVIGAAVYLFVIRKLLMRGGNYVDRWPVWLDMEHLLYRPLLLSFLPLVCGIVCRVFDSIVDTTVVVLRKTLYKDSPLPYERWEGSAATEAVGKAVNALQSLRNHLWGRKKQTHRDFVHLTAARVEDFRESFMIIQRSLSFGLLMFGIGLALTLIYILWW
ncbi:MAG: sodium:proton antiporter [Blautia sp.]|nr:sodium:proton antiporter [Blautia sp.]MCM1200291.1 hypothetical protein [Bacteroides fragilis]